MGLKDWLRANRNDEREQAYLFRAGAAGYTVASIGCLGLAMVYLTQGLQDQAMALVAIIGFSQVVFWGLIVRWRVGR